MGRKEIHLRRTRSAAALKRRQRGIFLISLGIICIVAAVVVFLLYRGLNEQGKNGESRPSQGAVSSEALSSSDSSSEPSSQDSSLPQLSQESGVLSSAPAPETSSGPASGESTPSQPAQSETGQPAWSPLGNVNPALPNPAPGDFSHALFIGDSRTEGLMRYTDLVGQGAVFYTSTGLNVKTAMTKGIVPDAQGNMLTIPQALATAQFNKVYIMLGVNELGWAYSNIFIEEYTKLVQAVQAAEPNAAVYIQAIIPVSAEKNASDPVYNNAKIAEYNGLIRQMAQNLGAGYLEVQQGIVDETGCLPAGATVDGVHMNKEYCQKWKEYLAANS